jgi:hypothetical protein
MRRIVLVLLVSATLAGGVGCETEPKRKDLRVDPQRVEAQRIDKPRDDKILPTWGTPKEKSWWEW